MKCSLQSHLILFAPPTLSPAPAAPTAIYPHTHPTNNLLPPCPSLHSQHPPYQHRHGYHLLARPLPRPPRPLPQRLPAPSFLSSPSKRAYWTSIPDDSPNTESEPSSSSRGEERLSKRVFTHLDALLHHERGKEELEGFQQEYARSLTVRRCCRWGAVWWIGSRVYWLGRGGYLVVVVVVVGEARVVLGL